MKPERVSPDGTKMKADASKRKAMSDRSMEEQGPRLEAEVAALLEAGRYLMKRKTAAIAVSGGETSCLRD